MAITYRHYDDVSRAKIPQVLKSELAELFNKNLNIAQSKTRRTNSTLSVKTQRLRCLNIVKAIEDIYCVGKFEITSLYTLKEKHINFLVDHWVEKKQLRGTIENKLTYLSTLARWLNKQNIVKETECYESLNNLPKRSGITLVDKSWESHGIDANELIGQIAKDDIIVAIQLMLQVTFGLRVQESMMLRPYDAIYRGNGDIKVHIQRGTKGNRPRDLRHLDESQLMMIELAKNYVNNTTKSTVPSDRTLKSWMDHYYYIIGKHGITKKNLGVTSHGLRSQNFNELYKKLTGVDSAVRGGEKPDREILTGVRQIIAEHAGHSAISKANAYIGSHAAMKIKTAKDLTDQQILAALKECEGNKMKAAETLKCARSYLYKRLKEMGV